MLIFIEYKYFKCLDQPEPEGPDTPGKGGGGGGGDIKFRA